MRPRGLRERDAQWGEQLTRLRERVGRWTGCATVIAQTGAPVDTGDLAEVWHRPAYGRVPAALAAVNTTPQGEAPAPSLTATQTITALGGRGGPATADARPDIDA